MIVILAEIDDRHIRIKLAKKQRGAKAAVADDQVGLDVLAILERLIDAIAMPDGVFERAGAEMVLRGRAAGELVLNALDARVLSADGLVGKRARQPWRCTSALAIWPNCAGKLGWT